MKEPSPAQAALRGLCPRCGNRTLFAGLAGFAPRCRACGLDFAAFNVGDGPAAFLIFIVGGIVVALAILVQLKAAPPWWVHVLLWVPLMVALRLMAQQISGLEALDALLGRASGPREQAA